jgi:hypothetical protein
MNTNFLKKGILPSTLLIISLLTVFTFSSCKKEGSDDNENNYYVKYVIKGNGTYGRFSNWTATTPGGVFTNSGYQTASWSQTYGPVKKGFKCEVQVGDYISGAPTIEIHVSKNDEPFALKVTNTGKLASYIIDF